MGICWCSDEFGNPLSTKVHQFGDSETTFMAWKLACVKELQCENSEVTLNETAATDSDENEGGMPSATSMAEITTDPPTTSPTAKPTDEPTNKPTDKPTNKPTNKPTDPKVVEDEGCCACTQSLPSTECAASTSCTSHICAGDSYCCNVQWDSICAESALVECKSQSVVSPDGTCCACTQISASGGCAASTSCESTVCEELDYCCTDQWDKLCTLAAGSICSSMAARDAPMETIPDSDAGPVSGHPVMMAAVAALMAVIAIVLGVCIYRSIRGHGYGRVKNMMFSEDEEMTA